MPKPKAMPTSKPKPKSSVKSIKHTKEKRTNIPTAEMEALVSDKVEIFGYQRNKDTDPQLFWRGKDGENRADLTVNTVPIYIQEKIHPEAIIARLARDSADRREKQTENTPDMFKSDFNGLSDSYEKVQFYEHKNKWSNRMILGDSLLVMSSLANKESMAGQVQCIYMDPPYGINFDSNWQRRTDNIEGKDKDESTEVEVIKAFRDTWCDGIHSYLSYLRDRLTVARDLLTESGSIFLQIGDENVHLAAVLMDEIFGAANRVATITFAKTSGSSTGALPEVADYLLWYAKDKEHVRYRQLYEPLDRKEIIEFFNFRAAMLELENGDTRLLTDKEQYNPEKYIPQGARIFKRASVESQGVSVTGRSEEYIWRNQAYHCTANGHWSVSMEGLDRMNKAGRLHSNQGQRSLTRKRYEFEVPGRRINNLWRKQMYAKDKSYVVETATSVVQRCILMTTDPGDLVLDPTCGSGVTATVAEQWGRRWITIDTSRVAITVARARLMGNQYDYYMMRDSEAGDQKEQELGGEPLHPAGEEYAGDVRHGFVYRRVTTLSPKDIADNAEIDAVWEKWQEQLEPLRQAFNKAAGKAHEEWEIPLVMPDDAQWNAQAQKIHREWAQARRQFDREMERCVAAGGKTVFLVDDPYTIQKTVRVTGPFTVESLSPYRILSPAGRADKQSASGKDGEAREQTPSYGDSAQQNTPISPGEAGDRFISVIHDNLSSSGIQIPGKKDIIRFEAIEALRGGEFVQFIGKYEENNRVKKAAICIGPEYGTVTKSLVTSAAREAGHHGLDVLVIMGFSFEAHAKVKDLANITIMPVHLNNDLHMAERLKNAKSGGNLFVALGEPDIRIDKFNGGGLMQVTINGADVYDPAAGKTRSSSVKDIACWMIDTDYNRESFFARHFYFTGGGKDPYEQLKKALGKDIDKETWSRLYSNVSSPFPVPENGKIAVKAINHYGDEVIKVFDVSKK